MKIIYLLASIPVILVGVGLYLAWLGGVQIAGAFESANWPTADGVVTVSEVTEIDLNERKNTVDEVIRFFVDFEYEYKVGETDYVGDCITIGQSGVRSRAEGKRRIEPYPVGKQVTVYFDPDEPDTACLVSGATNSSYMLLLAGIVMIVLTTKLTLAWLRELQSLRAPSPDSQSTN